MNNYYFDYDALWELLISLRKDIIQHSVFSLEEVRGATISLRTIRLNNVNAYHIWDLFSNFKINNADENQQIIWDYIRKNDNIIDLFTKRMDLVNILDKYIKLEAFS